MAAKKYGLVIRQKKKGMSSSIKKPSIFDNSSSDEEDNGMGKANSNLWRENKKNARLIESHGSVVKALEEDPSVFEYDSLYDDIQEKKKKSDPRLIKKDKTSKYIGHLKEVGKRRKLEQDIIYERTVQREMEREGIEYGDKETFLTSAYRKKLEERKILEEELKMVAKQEEVDDVTKQENMSRFHRNLLHRITEQDNKTEESEVKMGTSASAVGTSAVGTVGEEDKERPDSHRHSLEQDQADTEHSLEQDQADTEHTNQADTERLEFGGISDEIKTPHNDTSPLVEVAPLFPPTVDKEMKRKQASAKRTNEEALGSAKERYLARKKAKLSAPVISQD